MTNAELIKWLQRYPESMEVKIRVELVDNENGKVLINNCPIGLTKNRQEIPIALAVG